MKRILLGDTAKHTLTAFNAARRKFGLGPITNIVQLVRGDITLLPDLPELSGLPREELTTGYHYTGPVFSQLELPVPDGVRRVFGRPGLKIFCSFGSSGFPEVLKQVAAILRSRPDFNVVCTTTTIVAPRELGAASANFFAAPFLPAHRVAEMADIGVLHGGQGTIQSAVWAGLPVVGIGFQAEQQANIDGIARAGMAVRIPLYSVKPRSVLAAIDRVRLPEVKRKALELKELVRKSNGVEKSIQIMNDFLDGKPI